MSLPLAPIVLFAYNRPWHVRQTIAALQANTLAAESELFVFSDGPKNDTDKALVGEIREYLPTITGFRSLVTFFSEKNAGLAQSVIRGVSEIVNRYGRVIVLEDDMITTPDFLEFMNNALSVYEKREDIFSVTGYCPPIQMPESYEHDTFLVPRASSWGWGTWAAKWQKADWEVKDFTNSDRLDFIKNKMNAGGNDLWPMLVKQQRGVIDSWAVRWTYTQARHDAYGLYPVKSKVKNIGTDGSGTNFTFKSENYGNILSDERLTLTPDISPDAAVIDAFQKYYRMPFLLKIKNWIKYQI